MLVGSVGDVVLVLDVFAAGDRLVLGRVILVATSRQAFHDRVKVRVQEEPAT